jgi:2-polyprenyl-6-methoxyphenol hydroxylase-like FAD-dependent oxidoreductase
MVGEVVVVGGGPSGLTLASELAIGGLRPIVLERRTGTIESRAGTVLPRVLELFDARGIADRIIRKTARSTTSRSATIISTRVALVDWRNINSRFGFTLMIPQNATEEVLVNGRAKGRRSSLRHDGRRCSCCRRRLRGEGDG